MDSGLVVVVIAGVVFLVFCILVLRFPEEVKGLLKRFSRARISADGLALEFFEEAVRTKEADTPAEDIASTLSSLRAGSILWVDDVPGNNRLEVQGLRAQGLDVDVASSNAEALAYAPAKPYDVIISDIGRGKQEGPTEGLKLPRALRDAGIQAPVLFYVGRADGPQTETGEPVYDRPSELLHALGELLGDGEPG